MECGEGIEERHTQQQHSVPGHAERGEDEGFTSSRCGRQEDSIEVEQEIRQLREQVSVRYWLAVERYREHGI